MEFKSHGLAILLAKLSGRFFPRCRSTHRSSSEPCAHGQKSQSAEVTVARRSHLPGEGRRVKEKASLEHLELFAASSLADDRPRFQRHRIQPITACHVCPGNLCHAFCRINRIRLGREAHPIAQSQPALRTLVMISGVSEHRDHRSLLACIDGVVVRSQTRFARPRVAECLSCACGAQFVEVPFAICFGCLQLGGSGPRKARSRIKSGQLRIDSRFDLEAAIEFRCASLTRSLGQMRPIRC